MESVEKLSRSLKIESLTLADEEKLPLLRDAIKEQNRRFHMGQNLVMAWRGMNGGSS